MAGFGEELRAERMRQNLTLETISAQTKVNPRHFEAIERGDFLALPGGVFRKGIVRAYLAALSLEEEPWLARYQATWDSVAQSAALGSDEARRAEQDAWATFATNVQRGRGARRDSRPLHWLGVLGLFLLLAAAAWLLWQAMHHGSWRGPLALGPAASFTAQTMPCKALGGSFAPPHRLG